MHKPLTRKAKMVIVGILLSIGLLVGACTIEGGAPGREVCVGEGC